MRIWYCLALVSCGSYKEDLENWRRAQQEQAAAGGHLVDVYAPPPLRLEIKDVERYWYRYNQRVGSPLRSYDFAAFAEVLKMTVQMPMPKYRHFLENAFENYVGDNEDHNAEADLFVTLVGVGEELDEVVAQLSNVASIQNLRLDPVLEKLEPTKREKILMRMVELFPEDESHDYLHEMLLAVRNAKNSVPFSMLQIDNLLIYGSFCYKLPGCSENEMLEKFSKWENFIAVLESVHGYSIYKVIKKFTTFRHPEWSIIDRLLKGGHYREIYYCLINLPSEPQELSKSIIEFYRLGLPFREKLEKRILALENSDEVVKSIICIIPPACPQLQAWFQILLGILESQEKDVAEYMIRAIPYIWQRSLGKIKKSLISGLVESMKSSKHWDSFTTRLFTEGVNIPRVIYERVIQENQK